MRRTITIKGGEYTPINKQSSFVTSIYEQPGLSTSKELRHVVFDKPIPTQPIEYGTEDLTGQKNGGITIIGYVGFEHRYVSDGRGKKRWRIKHKWLGRCLCGKYVILRGQQWRRDKRKGITKHAYCTECKELGKVA